LYRELSQKKGSIYNSKEIRVDRANIIKLGYFSDILPPELQLDENGKVKITYKVKEKKANFINLGLETDKENILGFIQTNINHVGIPSSLLSTKAQFYREGTDIKIKSYSIGYYQPWFMNKWPLALNLEAWTKYNQRELFSDGTRYENERIGGDIILGYPLISNLLKLSEKIKVEEVKPVNSGDFSNYKILSLSSILDYSSLDNITNPKRGTYWSLEYEQGGNFGLNAQFLEYNRYSFNWATFLPINIADTIGLHLFAGLFRPYDKSIKTFEFEGFSIGGSSSLRGYPELTEIFGATRKTRKIQINCEYRHDINADLELVFFVDMGKLFDNDELTLEGAKYGYGVGLGWFTPLGPIRTDMAINTSKQILIHFNLGQVF
jgi:outer membrane protein insertion porin family